MFIKAFKARGFRVASAKHVYHAGFSIDQKGKDSWVHAEVGARPTIIVSSEEVAVIWRERKVRRLEDIVEMAGDADILVLEGFHEMFSRDERILRITLLRNAEEQIGEEDLKATFYDVDAPQVYKLPQQFPQLLEEVLRRLNKV